MSHRAFIIGDPHFGHGSLFKFRRADGSPLRPLWDNPDAMDEDMVKWWNEIVRPVDKTYILGDVAMYKKCLPILARLNGRKCLIKGNHDISKLKDYAKYFYDIRAYHRLDGIWMSHIPIHPQSVGRVYGNIHGHIHDQEVKIIGTQDIDPRYMCVSAEHTNYRPLEWGEAKERLFKRQEEFAHLMPPKEEEYPPTTEVEKQKK